MVVATLRIRTAASAIALPIATLLCGCATGSHGEQPLPDAMTRPDASKPDAAAVLTPDAAPDASIDAPGCAINTGVTPALDGTDDLAAYPTTQRLTPAAMLGADAAAIVWDRERIYITVKSPAFAAAYEPLHVYLEAMPTAEPVASMGKEYAGLTPRLPFTPTHLIAVRRVSDSGTGPYNGVFVSSNGYQTRTVALDTDTFSSSSELSVQVPWTAFGGCPTSLRIALHVVHAVNGNEWKDLVPSTHTPWQMPGGGFYEVDTTAAPDVTNWSLR